MPTYETLYSNGFEQTFRKRNVRYRTLHCAVLKCACRCSQSRQLFGFIVKLKHQYILTKERSNGLCSTPIPQFSTCVTETVAFLLFLTKYKVLFSK